MPSSRAKVEIARLLKEEGYIRDFRVEEGESFRTLVVELKYGRNRERVITDLKRISKPGRRVYARKDRLPRVLGGMGTAILSTSNGVMTGRTAEQKGSAAKDVSCGSSEKRWSRIGRQLIDAGRRQHRHRARPRPGHGPLGELDQDIPQRMTVERQDETLVVTRPTDRGDDRALHGLTRTLVANMVEGVTRGFEKRLEIQGWLPGGLRATISARRRLSHPS
jgi:small subunit ribosomal protein S8